MAKAKKKDDADQNENLIGTSEAAEIVSEAVGADIDAKQLRIYIRDSAIFGDQRSKRYGFEGADDPKLKELIGYVEERRTRKKSEEEGEDGGGKASKKKKSKKKKRKLQRKDGLGGDDQL